LQGEALEGYKDLLHDSIQKNKELEDLINQLQNKVGQAILVANNLGGGGGGSSSSSSSSSSNWWTFLSSPSTDRRRRWRSTSVYWMTPWRRIRSLRPLSINYEDK